MYKTEQENFWVSSFGEEYIKRNSGEEMLAANTALFASILNNTKDVNSLIEFGANIGMNLKAIKSLKPQAQISAIEINPHACNELRKSQDINVIETSILNYEADKKYDFVLIKGVLIHINPEELDLVYEKLYNSSSKYICLVEYYNPTPVSVLYRGEKDKLFKRDFAGEMLDKYSDLELVNYGFTYRRDNNFEYDDLNWFLLKKNEK